ncbi:type I phosphomannose isomerase catalytic subunit [Exiguobacterium sp. ZWU0009]|uniref:type I phosphomannose isomerase catalytic subunit n=1 Tax=Exiguobacterium sp. ZWU0009 TaxID=1224749 RepID=UPI000647515B|nr:type I phosphomannose isomerase catalytic subunit [Exiguobacterium sp. ZWU0009]
MILKLEPIFQERIWGSQRLKEEFDYEIPHGTIGECWGISAHQNGENTINNGPYSGHTLSELWANYRQELFGDFTHETFPLLVKILDATDDLSVQVHPNDEQAYSLEGERFGKTECWYVLDAAPGSELILGHTAQTKAELEVAVANEKWSDLLKRQPVKKGDFVFVESGTIHAIGKGIMILETQQSCDTTYRVYDFDRTDDKGNKRELHLEKALAVTTVPDIPVLAQPSEQLVHAGMIRTLVQSPEFDVYHHRVSPGYVYPKRTHFSLMTIIEGTGILQTDDESLEVTKGDHLIVTKNTSNIIVASGQMEWITSEIGHKQ